MCLGRILHNEEFYLCKSFCVNDFFPHSTYEIYMKFLHHENKIIFPWYAFVINLTNQFQMCLTEPKF